ncbi:hypothetical protein CDAR_195561 [Caerostris darwini]|uniref:Uncharacterized protein n=1 Tax=Caerostris darwini TaxID=1538125 RepID=A0AAV4NF13_9ARAC|nr:hypothetical protein CDAR_195561 [Caerostris darwini]
MVYSKSIVESGREKEVFSASDLYGCYKFGSDFIKFEDGNNWASTRNFTSAAAPSSKSSAPELDIPVAVQRIRAMVPGEFSASRKSVAR